LREKEREKEREREVVDTSEASEKSVEKSALSFGTFNQTSCASIVPWKPLIFLSGCSILQYL